MPPRRLTMVMTATKTSWSCGPGKPKSRWAAILQYCSRRSPSFVRTVFRASVLSSYLSRRLNMKSGASSRLTSTWISGPPSKSKSLSSWIPLSAKTLNYLPRTTYRTFNKKQIHGAQTVGREVFRVLQEYRAALLSESTLCFAEWYGNLCWEVRYSLSEGTVILAGQYGNPCRAVRYALPSAHRLKNLCFCWAFANKSLEDGWVGSKRKGEFTGRHG